MRRGTEILISLAVLVVLSISVYGDDPVVVISHTTPAKDPVDDTLKCPKDKDSFLTCAVTNKPVDSDVKWIATTLDGSKNIPISTNLNSEDPFKYSLEQPSPTAWRLKVQNVQVTDEGRYICRVQTGPQIYTSDVVEIRVTEVPQIANLLTSSDTTVKEGDKVTLLCNATGRPLPIVSWRRMAGELLPSGGRELQKYELNIESVSPKDAGVYKCSAKNFAGLDERPIKLQVKFSPQVTAKSSRVGQKPGYVKNLECVIAAYPPPEIDQVTWSHGSQALYNYGRFEIRTIPGAYNRMTTTLTIHGVQPEDYGIYRCSAVNEQGDDNTNIELFATDVATPDKTGKIVSCSSALATSVTTIIMLLVTCLLHRLDW